MLIGYGFQTVPPEWRVEEKTACGYVRVYDVYSGHAVYEDGGGSRPLKAGSICLFPSAAPFSIHHDPGDPLCCTHLHLDVAPAVLRQMTVVSAEEGSLPRKIFDALRTAAAEGNEEVLEPLAAAFEVYCRQQGLFLRLDSGISAALLAMSGDVRKNWRLRELGALAGYSESYFIRRFRAEVGVPPHQYLISCRMKHAARLLWNKETPIGQVAEQSGYPDLKAFSRAFSAHYGLSPSAYRQAGRLFP
ncbi:MAG TPA: helix-turn-helix transcriptional regulator [Candidatus Merdivicinus intestinigallinarum]|nr:helix-turn-helix transcriptional regulator [Candidatus Merdivicinus intestinigallinarum]